MNELALRLLPDGRDPQELVLHHQRSEHSILDTLSSSSSYVYCDYPYSAQLLNAPNGINNLLFLLNGVEVDINYSPENGKIYFHDENNRDQIFRECYGFAQITIIFNDESDNKIILDTEYIHVMVRKGPKNDAVKRMTDYVYSQNSSLFAGFNTIPKDTTGLKESEKKTVESHLLLLKKISLVYEETYRYFKANSRFTIVPKERVDHFEKLQYISANTIHYISQHPEELQLTNHPRGIRIGKSFYQPNKTLITDNAQSYDIYENRVILGFLRYLLSEIERIRKDLMSLLEKVPQKPLEKDEYITSTFFIYTNSLNIVRTLLKEVDILHQKYSSLYYSYSEVLQIPCEPVSCMPRLTAVFKSVPQYHQIYDCAFIWFSNGVFTVREEQFMLSVIKISTLYELYVLTKLINYFQKTGYSLLSSERVSYVSPGKYYENTSCNNRFVLNNAAGTITLYYQPVVYNANREDHTGIGLYRNTSISFPKNDDAGFFGGRYYTPDYLIKYEYANSRQIKYLIADAKFSTLQTVKRREVAGLAYKYIFSISPTSKDSQVVGLCIFNGQSEQASDDTFTNIYDYELTDPIAPRASIITLTESRANNEKLHDALLRNAIGVFTTEEPQRLISIPVALSQGESLQEETVIHDQENDLLRSTTEQQEPPKPAQNSVSVREKEKTPQPSPQKEKRKKGIDKTQEALDQSIKELKLDIDLEQRLLEAGLVSIGDLVPNQMKTDLSKNVLLNRRARRVIEARLKQKKIILI